MARPMPTPSGINLHPATLTCTTTALLLGSHPLSLFPSLPPFFYVYSRKRTKEEGLLQDKIKYKKIAKNSESIATVCNHPNSRSLLSSPNHPPSYSQVVKKTNISLSKKAETSRDSHQRSIKPQHQLQPNLKLSSASRKTNHLSTTLNPQTLHHKPPVHSP